MAAVDLDRQAIERKDFPISRRGYDTAVVDAHLQALAREFEALKRDAGGAGESPLASAAGSQVQSIIQAAEKAAAEIERQALEDGRAAREQAEREAERHAAEGPVAEAGAPGGGRSRFGSRDGGCGGRHARGATPSRPTTE